MRQVYASTLDNVNPMAATLASVVRHVNSPRAKVRSGLFQKSLALVLLLLPACSDSQDKSKLPTSPPDQAAPNVLHESRSVAPNQVTTEEQPEVWFEDVTKATGIQFTYKNGREGEKYTLLESIGGGVALIDYDNDGDLDIFITGGGQIGGSPTAVSGVPSAFYRNDGNWKFTDVTSDVGLDSATDYTIACSSADYDRDGHPDLLVTGYPQTRLFRNTGNRRFEDVTGKLGLPILGLHTASAWPDVNNDGWPDLYVTGYVKFDLHEGRKCGDLARNIKDICGIWQYPPAPDRLFLNHGGTNFEEISKAAGILEDGKGLGVVASDFNEDGHIDLYVANDYTANQLYLGIGNNKFEESALLAGVAVDEFGIPQGSMGVDVGDFDGDGRGDLFLTNYQLEDNILYRNLGHGQFSTLNNGAIGLGNICRPYVGFGTGWVDFDLDGWLDLFVLNGHVMYSTGQSPYQQPSFLFRNQAGAQFRNVTKAGGSYFSNLHVARGAAAGDLDDDGACDLVVVHQNAPVSVLRNRLNPPHWTSVELVGVRSEPHAVGATVTVTYDGRSIVRHVRSGAGYLSQFDRRILFPMRDETPAQCEVRWLNRDREVFHNIQPKRTNRLVEGEGERVD